MEIESLLPLPAPVFHILIALAEGDRHGYAIMQDIATRTDGKLRLGPGTLYGSIKKLLEQGWIEEITRRPADDDERRRYYRLTRLGRRVAEAEASRLADILKQARANGLVPQRS
ncbi:MAG: PadR family transcriptional regulator [Bryobacteraceae bacterium]|nr:PadR family transcriptional regulator [Bryobacteraceae bacterium]